MSKLILHVGTHKTGTTTIQDTFALNRRFLAEKGVIFPQIGKANGQHGLVMDWISLPEFYHLDTSAEEAWTRLARDHGKSDRTVLISTEELSRGNPKMRVDLRRLRDLVSGFDDIKVVCCLRNQVSFLQSIYLQVIKSGAHVSWPGFFEGAVGSRTATGLFLDYNDLRNYLETGFSPEEIRFFSYEREIRSVHGIIGRLMIECGLEGVIGSLEDLPAGHSNVSPDPLATWVAAHVLGNKPFKPWLLETTREALDDTGKGGGKTTIFTKDEFRKIKDTFDPPNGKFNDHEAMLGTGMELADFPDEANLTFRDALIPAYWVNLSRRLVDKL
ncbi:hypothetical protein GIY56_15825 [Paracoccus sp. YIM 132242]|uniref:Sulfotransferase domain-containing protein n=1 Tax=Paracoccus lichenicola TaxID=2665644 RepID=A0A6L6HTP0_9RHOB|nr:hypothetical protein [Paracoccus lichenicola]MTE01759.1 hypothetical protein [Paracoccus lichenicola]